MTLGLLDWFCERFEFLTWGRKTKELSGWLEIPVEELREVNLSYSKFSIPKKSGATRTIHSPNPRLKNIQRTILRKLLAGLRSHEAAVGFEKGKSIVTGARQHVGKTLVLHFDIVDFFPNTNSQTVYQYFRKIGWSRASANLLTRIVTHQGALPQGAPTSPRLSNLVNFLMDQRLSTLAASVDGTYTRYADDITISFDDDWFDLEAFISMVFAAIYQQGYQPHFGKKMKIRRRNKRQTVNGLVVNEKVNLPRERRRWLRAVKHRAKAHWRWSEDGEPDQPSVDFAAAGSIKRPTISQDEFAGWLAFEKMIAIQGTEEP